MRRTGSNYTGYSVTPIVSPRGNAHMGLAIPAMYSPPGEIFEYSVWGSDFLPMTGSLFWFKSKLVCFQLYG